MKEWTSFLDKQASILGDGVVDKWLRNLRVAHFDSRNLYLEASDHFQIAWFEEYARPLLKTQFLSQNGKPIKVHLSLSHGPVSSKTLEEPTPSLVSFDTDPLDPLFTWDQLIFSEENAPLLQLLEALTSTTPKIPLGTFNPIYIWGEPSCGKTHLLTALNFLFKAKGLKALYATMDTFTEHAIYAIRSSSMHAFRSHYRNVDILLIDDIHTLSLRFATQEEFFHTFNTLYGQKKQVILASNCLPAKLHGIEPRLVSRFEWGINFHLHTLKKQELKTLAKSKLDGMQFMLPQKSQEFLTTHFKTAKGMQKALNTLMLRAHLNHLIPEDLTPQDLEQLLGTLVQQERLEKLSASHIQEATAKIYQVSLKDLLGKSQAAEHSLPRQVAIYLCREMLHLPYQTIGKLFGRDHSTIITSVRQIHKRLDAKEPTLTASLNEIQTQLKMNFSIS